MDQPAPAPETRKHRGLTGTLLFFGALGVTGTAAWLYLRHQQKVADEQTRDRLAPRGGSGA